LTLLKALDLQNYLGETECLTKIIVGEWFRSRYFEAFLSVRGLLGDESG